VVNFYFRSLGVWKCVKLIFTKKTLQKITNHSRKRKCWIVTQAFSALFECQQFVNIYLKRLFILLMDNCLAFAKKTINHQ